MIGVLKMKRELPPSEPKRMDAAEYRAAMDTFGVTHKAMAGALGISIRSSFGYANSDPIPNPTAKLIRLWLQLRKTPHKLDVPPFVTTF
jgi:hypothetical protein